MKGYSYGRVNNPIQLDSTARVGSESMRPLVIDAKAKATADRVRAHAEKPANVYRPGPGVLPPGDNPEHCCLLNTYRVVYSLTAYPEGGIWRHLSVSIEGGRLFPNLAAVITIADLFDFTGWDQVTLDKMPESWQAGIDKRNRAVVVAEKVQRQQ